MMYGPTGAGKSHTMFGCSKQPGIVYRALRDILGVNEEDDDGMEKLRFGSFVQVSVLEIYNEEIYDLLSNNAGRGGFGGLGWPKGNSSKVRLEVMGKKAKNATFLSGNEAGKISREVAKVEKRRIVKSTHCNERSSRSHCMIILDVPTVGGRLMLVDMAGSENIEQAGQIGFEAKMQTAKINQGNIALKRVVESIANGDSHVPFRDSKLTMLLQDSFEDDKSKILMILCCSPDPREIHKTISTLEYGAKAKCIVRGGHTPNKDKINTEDGSAVILGSRIAAMDQFIAKLQVESKRREKERNEAHKELMKKEEEVASLRAKLELMERRKPVDSEEEINLKIKEREQILKDELDNKLQECQKMADDFVETERRIMEEKILQQQQELHLLSQRLAEVEAELSRTKGSTRDEKLQGKEESGLAKRMMELYGDQGMEKSMDLVKSMDLDMGDRHPIVVHVGKEVDKGTSQPKTCSDLSGEKPSDWSSVHVEEEDTYNAPKFPERVYLSTVYEEEEGQDKESTEDEEVEKEVVEETVHFTRMINDTGLCFKTDTDSEIQNPKPYTEISEKDEYFSLKRFAENDAALGLANKTDNTKDPESTRITRIQNIFLLCGNHRELAHHVGTPTQNKKITEAADVQSSPMVALAHNEVSENPCLEDFKENNRPNEESNDSMVEVYVKWEATKECPGKFITKLNVKKDSTLADLRKLVESELGDNSSKQGFSFLLLGDPSGAPVSKEKETSVQASKLPNCNNQQNIHFACLRPIKESQKGNISVVPFSSLENKLHTTSPFSPKIGKGLTSSPLLSSMFIERNF
ncbi:hypothetical protein ACHQM5_014151 [Ranunculus cassubicifolius]